MSPTIAYLTLEETAAILRVSPCTARQYARSGIIKARKIGKSWRFLEADLYEAGEANARPAASALSRSVPSRRVASSRVAQIARALRQRASR
jgi:excisionase family DNA binding protein